MEHRTASDAEWEAAMQRILKDWDWSKHYPKRDVEFWQDVAGEFASEWDTVMSNYNEDEGRPGSRNSDELMEFFKFCVKYPDLRFFQALSIFIRQNIYVMEQNPDSTTGMMLPGKLHDTFAWEKNSYERYSEP